MFVFNNEIIKGVNMENKLDLSRITSIVSNYSYRNNRIQKMDIMKFNMLLIRFFFICFFIIFSIQNIISINKISISVIILGISYILLFFITKSNIGYANREIEISENELLKMKQQIEVLNLEDLKEKLILEIARGIEIANKNNINKIMIKKLAKSLEKLMDLDIKIEKKEFLERWINIYYDYTEMKSQIKE